MAKHDLNRTCPRCSKKFIARFPKIVFCSHPCADAAMKLPIEERFLRHVSNYRGEGCWEWIGSTRGTTCSGKRYGAFGVNGRLESAHRVSWTIFVGPIPSGSLVLHGCDNPACVRPSHLFLGDHLSNAADKMAKGRFRPSPGERNGGAKLTEADVLEIRASSETCRESAKRLGVTPEAIGMIHRRKTWKHLGAGQ